MPAKTWDYLGKVTAMLLKAESTEHPDEAAAFRAKAEQFMRRYRIEEENLLAEDATSVEPIYVEEFIHPMGSEFSTNYRYMIHLACEHAGVRQATFYRGGEKFSGMVGYEGDVRIAAYIFAAARLVFQSKLEPEVDPNLSEAENVYRLRSAGMTRERVGQILFADSGIKMAAASAKVSRLYERECARRGEDPALGGRGIDLKVFRKAYGDNFTYTLSDRLREARDAADSVGGPLVLHGRKERVDEAFYAKFPTLRPVPPSEVAVTETAPEKDYKPRKRTKAEEARTERLYYSKAAERGGAAGNAAAREIELDRASNAKRVMNGEAGEIEG